MVRRIAFALLAGAAALLPIGPVKAQSVADFYKGKIVKFILSAGEGGGYGTYATAIQPYMQKYLPGNPRIIIQHMQGAGGLVAANNIYNVAPKDGTVFALIHRGAVSTAGLFDAKNARFEPAKFSWIGSMNDEISVCAVRGGSKVKSFEDLRTTPITVGGLGPGGDTDTYTNMINNVFGTKMRLVTGYDSGVAIDLAMERGEVDGRCAWSWSTISSTKMDWVKEKKIRLLVQTAVEKHPDLPDVPLLADFAKTDDQRQILDIVVSPSLMGRPLLMPPGVPADRLAAFREAFKKSMEDPQFLADAKKQNLEIGMVSGEQIKQMLARLYALPKAIVEKAARSVESSGG
jgi:tripartite-type tricarboxylate transporter receptor subunit TctC